MAGWHHHGSNRQRHLGFFDSSPERLRVHTTGPALYCTGDDGRCKLNCVPRALQTPWSTRAVAKMRQHQFDGRRATMKRLGERGRQRRVGWMTKAAVKAR